VLGPSVVPDGPDIMVGWDPRCLDDRYGLDPRLAARMTPNAGVQEDHLGPDKVGGDLRAAVQRGHENSSGDTSCATPPGTPGAA